MNRTVVDSVLSLVLRPIRCLFCYKGYVCKDVLEIYISRNITLVRRFAET